MTVLPIRWKFALWASALTGMALGAFSIGTFFNLYQEQIEAVDAEIKGEARHFLELQSGDLEQKSTDEIFRYHPWFALVYFDERGRIKFRSDPLPEELARAALTVEGLHTAHAAGKRWRLAAWPRGEEVFVVAYDLQEVYEIVGDLVIGYSLSLPVVLLIAGFGGWWVAGRALRPVSDLTAAAERVQAAKLGQRVPVPAAKDEIQRLAMVLNAMLSRLEGSFMQAQRFAADASHELRTPLTIMGGEVERLLHANGLSLAQETKLVNLQEGIARLDRITEHLLLLARYDAGKAQLKFEHLDLSHLVREVGEDAELLAAANDVRVTMKVGDSFPVMGDAAQLRRLLLNLLQNAAHYNQAGGEIICTLEQKGTRLEVRVANTGPGIPAELRARVFERFFRGDPSREERRGHGLGLSLCREIAHAHGGEVFLDPDVKAGWTEFVVTLPITLT